MDDAKQKLIDELYSRIDYGLTKKDAPGIADAIEALIDEKIAALMPVYAMKEKP